MISYKKIFETTIQLESILYSLSDHYLNDPIVSPLFGITQDLFRWIKAITGTIYDLEKENARLLSQIAGMETELADANQRLIDFQVEIDFYHSAEKYPEEYEND